MKVCVWTWGPAALIIANKIKVLYKPDHTQPLLCCCGPMRCEGHRGTEITSVYTFLIAPSLTQLRCLCSLQYLMAAHDPCCWRLVSCHSLCVWLDGGLCCVVVVVVSLGDSSLSGFSCWYMEDFFFFFFLPPPFKLEVQLHNLHTTTYTLVHIHLHTAHIYLCTVVGGGYAHWKIVFSITVYNLPADVTQQKKNLTFNRRISLFSAW